MDKEPVISIGIDLGTSGCRAIAIDQDHQIIASHQQAITETGTEQDPQCQWQTVKDGLSQVITQCKGLTTSPILITYREVVPVGKKIGQAVTSLGSTLVVKLISEQPIFVPEQGLYRHRLANLWLVGGASNTGSTVLRHFFNDQALEQLSEQIDLKAPTLDYYPLLAAGERFPINDPTLQAWLTPRLESDITFCHSLLQSLANIERMAYQCLEAAGTNPVAAVYTVGGGSNNTVCVNRH